MTSSFARPSSIPSDDRGFLLGDALFETIALHGGAPFRLDHHLRRLREAASRVGIPVPSDLDRRVEEAVREAAEADAALRITLSRGSAGGLAPDETSEPRLVVALRPVNRSARPEELLAALYGRIDERALTAGFKAVGYLERIQALRLARAEGCDEALLRNTRDRIVEGSASNLFAVVGESLLAPGRGEGALPGVTREAVLEVARDQGVAVEERGLDPEELAAASELMLSSSIRGLAPVVAVSGSPVGFGKPGPVFGRLHAGLESLVEREAAWFRSRREGSPSRSRTQPSP